MSSVILRAFLKVVILARAISSQPLVMISASSVSTNRYLPLASLAMLLNDEHRLAGRGETRMLRAKGNAFSTDLRYAMLSPSSLSTLTITSKDEGFFVLDSMAFKQRANWFTRPRELKKMVKFII